MVVRIGEHPLRGPLKDGETEYFIRNGGGDLETARAGIANPHRPGRRRVIPLGAEHLGGKPDMVGDSVSMHDAFEVRLQFRLLCKNSDQ